MESPEHLRRDIRRYFELEVDDEKIEHLERVASQRVLEREYDVWDVHTDKGRWWVITSPTNLYRQDEIKSMDVALSFHIGLTLRVLERSRIDPVEGDDERFSAPWRQLEQAHEALDEAHEAEDFQAVGMRARECLLKLARAFATDQVKAESTAVELPNAGDFNGWTRVVADVIARGESAKERRAYLKETAVSAWKLASWLTHAQNATRFDGYLVLDAAEHTLNVMILSFVRWERGEPDRCPDCGSYRIVQDFRMNDEEDTYEDYSLCETCGWEQMARPPTSRPHPEPQDGSLEDAPPPPPSDDGDDECIEPILGRTYTTPQDFIDRRS